MHYCNQCDKKYKTRRSLYTHNSRYHPYSKKVKFSDNTSPEENEFDEDRSTDVKQYSQIMRNKFDLTLLKDDVDRLSKQVWGLDMKMVVPNLTPQTGGGSKILDDNKIHKEELEFLKDQSRINKAKLSTVEDKLESLIESFHTKNRIAVEDLIDDLSVVKQLFMNQRYEELVSDIPRLRLVAKLVVSVMDVFYMGDITDENIKLLEKIGDSSKTKVKMLLKDKFNTLVDIFTKLKIDELYDEESDSDNNDSEGMDDDHFNRPQSDDSDHSESDNESDNDADSDSGSDSGDESDSKKSDEDSSNSEHSDREKSDRGKKTDSDNDSSDNEGSNIDSSDSVSEGDTETVFSQ